MTKKFKSLSKKEKVEYIWDYYKLHIAIVIFVIGVLFSYISRFSNQIDTDVYCLVFNDPENEELCDHIKSTYTEYIGDKNITASVDLGYIFSYDETEKMNWPNESSIVKYMALQASGEADTIITDYNSMLWAAKVELLKPVDEVLTEELYTKLKPYFVYIDEKDAKDENQTKIIYGLDITESKIYKNHSYNYDKAILCFPNVSKNPDTVIKFVKYMYGID